MKIIGKYPAKCAAALHAIARAVEHRADQQADPYNYAHRIAGIDRLEVDMEKLDSIVMEIQQLRLPIAIRVVADIGVDNQEPPDVGEILPYEIHPNLAYSVTLRFVGGSLEYEGQAEPVAPQGAQKGRSMLSDSTFGTSAVP
jgi:hypothetical protein